MSIDEQIEILEAFKAGKAVQFYNRVSGSWESLDKAEHRFNFHAFQYRVKQTPRVLWVHPSDLPISNLVSETFKPGYRKFVEVIE